jgi:hypothetical protein
MRVKAGSDPHWAKIQKLKRLRTELRRAVDDHIGGLEAQKMEPWREAVYRLMAADSHHFKGELDLEPH